MCVERLCPGNPRTYGRMLQSPEKLWQNFPYMKKSPWPRASGRGFLIQYDLASFRVKSVNRDSSYLAASGSSMNKNVFVESSPISSTLKLDSTRGHLFGNYLYKYFYMEQAVPMDISYVLCIHTLKIRRQKYGDELTSVYVG